MARQQRQELAGGWHHVMNRGARHQAIFFDDNDRHAFLRLLSTATQAFNIETHAYCLMGNHYHLLLRTPEPNLGRAMQLIGCRFTQYFNGRHGLDGALFRGRYTSVLAADERQTVAIARYIHRNPIEAAFVRNAEQYRWSSYRFYVRQQPRPSWLTTKFLLELEGGSEAIRCATEEGGARRQAAA